MSNDDFGLLPRWKPRPIGKDDRSKRRAKTKSPWTGGTGWHQAAIEQLDAILVQMGKSISATQKTVLLARLNEEVLNLFDLMRRFQHMPSPSEKREVIAEVANAAKALLSALGVQRSATEILREDTLAWEVFRGVGWQELNETVRECFGEVEHDCRAIASATTAVAHIANWAERATTVETIASGPKFGRHPQAELSIGLAGLYREFFGCKPVGKSWLMFLRWALEIADPGQKHKTDDALRKMPTSF